MTKPKRPYIRLDGGASGWRATICVAGFDCPVNTIGESGTGWSAKVTAERAARRAIERLRGNYPAGEQWLAIEA